MELIDEIEEEIDKLKNNEYGFIINKTKNKGIITTSIIIPKDIINKNISEMSIEFQLIIDTISLKLIPKLYCVSAFCYPNFADGRDLFNELRSTKNPNKNNWIANLLSDILEFIKINYEKGGLYFIGNYYLGSKYDLRLFQKSCDNILNVKENLVINGKSLKLNRVLIISDVYFLLFEQEKWYKNNLTLLFWSSISNIQKIQKVKDTKTVILQWAQKEKNTYPMSLTLPQREAFIRELLEKMHHFGMIYDVTRMDGGKIKKEDISQSQNVKLINDYNRQELEKNKNNEEEEEEEYEEGEEEEDDIEENNKPNEGQNVKLDVKQNNIEENNQENNNNQNKAGTKDENNNEENNKVQKENKEEQKNINDNDDFIEVNENKEVKNKNGIKENFEDKPKENKEEIKLEEKGEVKDDIKVNDNEEVKIEEKKENEPKE